MRGRVIERAVEPALRQLRRRARKVERDRIAGDNELERIAQRRAERIVPHLARIGAVRQRADRIAHRGLGTALQHTGERLEVVDAVLAHEGDEPLSADRIGGHERMDVAEHLRRIADVLGDQREQVLVGHALAMKLHGRDLQAFLVDLPGLERILGAADIADVPDRADEPDQAVVVEHRREHRDVE